MSRVLVIPAAGLGSRLGATVPKVMVPVAGEPMLDRLLRLYRRAVDHVIVVVNPLFADTVRRYVAGQPGAERVECVEQAAATGMLDAILLGLPAAKSHHPSSVWVTWCDQVAVHRQTIDRLAALTSTSNHDALVMPTVVRQNPYIHFQRDTSARIVRVLHRREGDAMPAVGESDMGLFAMSPQSFFSRLPEYAESVEVGQSTRERNFLPFIPWIARTETVTTFPAEDPMEAVGVNTPEELIAVENYLRSADVSNEH